MPLAVVVAASVVVVAVVAATDCLHVGSDVGCCKAFVCLLASL